MAEHVPSPADAPILSARELLQAAQRRGGRIFRMREHHVICITRNQETASWLESLGGLPYRPFGIAASAEFGGYRRAKDGPVEWDIYIQMIPVAGDETIWQAAGEVGPTVEATDFA